MVHRCVMASGTSQRLTDQEEIAGAVATILAVLPPRSSCLGRLQEAKPDRFSLARLRMLQRRVQQWRGIMASKLVYAASEVTLPDPRWNAGNSAGRG